MSKTGDIFTAEVETIVEDGRGLVRRDNGHIFFVPGVLAGEEIKCRVEKSTSRSGDAALLKILRPSPHRVTPACLHSGFQASQCGGCSWMHIDYATQLQYKQKFVASALLKMTNGSRAVLQDIVPSPKQLAYRNRARLKTNGQKIGFTSYQSKKFAPIDNCEILTEKNQKIVSKIQERLPVEKWKPKNKADLNILHIDENCDADNIYIGADRPFAQGNGAQNIWMKRWLEQQLKKIDTAIPIVELFCGSGNFTQSVIDSGFSKTFAFEADKRSIDLLQKNNIDKNCSLYAEALDLFSSNTLDEILEKYPAITEAEVLLLDPPRSGFTFFSQWIKALPKLKTILYVSCKPSTFFRDMQSALALGFTFQELQPVDQFPQTPHVELLGVLEKNEEKVKLEPARNKKPLRRRLRKF